MPNYKHHQCKQCNKMTYGPFKDTNPGYQAVGVEGGKLMSNQEATVAGIHFEDSDEGVSHTMCPECQKVFFEELRQRAVMKKPIPEAVTPIPEAYEPVPEAVTPVE